MSEPHKLHKALLGSNDIRQEYGFGRDLTLAVQKMLPFVSAGTSGRSPKLYTHRDDLERLLAKARLERADLWELVKSGTDLTEWAGLSREGDDDGR